jgi:hypothetical protein
VARIRSIKPEFFTDDELAELPPLARLLFIGLWTQADKAGRLKDKPIRIKTSVLPYDDCDCDALLQALADAGFIIRYTVGDSAYIEVVNFATHQRFNNESDSTIPPVSEDYVSTSVGLIHGREGKGREGREGNTRAEKPPPMSNFPPCFSDEVEREGVSASFRGHLLRDLEGYAGTWPSIPKNQGYP